MISAEMVTQTVERLSETEPAELQKMMNRMSQEQPYPQVYLLAMTEREQFDEEETEIFFHAGVVIWQLMRQNPHGMRRITERVLNKAEKANERLLAKMAADSEGDFLSAAEAMAINFP